MKLSWKSAMQAWRENPPVLLKFRSSKWLIGTATFVAAFTDGFLMTTVVPVLPFSLVARSGVAEENVQFWLSLFLITFGITMALAAPIAGWVTDRSSSRQLPCLVGFTLAFAATLLFCFGRAPWVLALARAFQGFSASIIYTAGLALIADTVPAEEVGSWIGFVLSGMNGGALTGPLVAGVVYEKAGYYAVFGVVLGVVALDFLLQAIMVEKKRAARWLDHNQFRQADTFNPPHSVERETERIHSHGRLHSQTSISVGSSAQAERESDEQDRPEADERTSLLPRPARSSKPWFTKNFPTMSALLGSSRIRAAVYGCFTHTTLIASFDAVLPQFVKRTFGWNATGAGLIFLAITIPSTAGAAIGALSDRYGTRKVSLAGFILTTPSLALMGLAKRADLTDEVLLCVLLFIIGIGLNLILAPLAADMFHEVDALSKADPETFGPVGAFAQAYSLFDAALGAGTAVGPAWAGLFYEKTNWQITAGVLALACAVGGYPVWRYTGRGEQREEPKVSRSAAAD